MDTMALWEVSVPRDRAGSGIAHLTINDQAFRNWRIKELHLKLADRWPLEAEDCKRIYHLPRGRIREGFRVVLADRTASGNRQRVRFHLDRPAPRSALLVLGDHLTEVGIDWLYFLNESGFALTHRGARIGKGLQVA